MQGGKKGKVFSDPVTSTIVNLAFPLRLQPHSVLPLIYSLSSSKIINTKFIFVLFHAKERVHQGFPAIPKCRYYLSSDQRSRCSSYLSSFHPLRQSFLHRGQCRLFFLLPSRGPRRRDEVLGCSITFIIHEEEMSLFPPSPCLNGSSPEASRDLFFFQGEEARRAKRNHKSVKYIYIYISISFRS